MAFDNSFTKTVLSSSLRPTPKRCEPRLFWATLGQVIRCSKAVDLGSLNMQFQHDWPKDKNITAVLCFAWKLGKMSVLSEQVWSAIFPQPWVARCPNLAHPQTCMQFSNRTSLETLQPSEVLETVLHHASIGVKCELVWSATFLGSTSKCDTS